MRSVGIVCGYDLNDGLPDYVKSVAPLIARENLDFVILSGGRTSPRSHHSEAWVMAGHLRKILASPELVLEEHAMTTLENLIFARGLAEHHAGVVARFVVFCD
ncbi:MAG: ElyC/SanA/YdcF family protein, partial [Thermoanaerobaculia bacterium]